MSRTMATAICTSMLAALALASCGDVAETGRPASGTGPQLVWSACQKGFQCATLQVPLDHAEPDGETIGLALIRASAADPSRRIGSLVFNFGGPGGSGIETLPEAAGDLKNLNTRYDLVSFDPRGVGRSAPVRCSGPLGMDRLPQADASPDDAAEEKAFVESTKSFNQACETRSGKLLPHVGTVNAARDMDLLRAALGDERLFYFGISYGTWLGASHARQLPGKVGRAVLDAAVDPTLETEELNRQQAASSQLALGNFAARCARMGGRICPIGRDRDEVVGAVTRLVARLDQTPLPARKGRRLTEGLAVAGISAALQSERIWPTLAQGLAEAIIRRDGGTLLSLADIQTGRDERGFVSNETEANAAVRCADTTRRFTPEDVRAALPRFRQASPVFGPAAAWALLQCTGWPVPGDDAAKEVGAPDAAPMVVIGNTGDPATPFDWAPGLTKELGGNTVLLTLRGEGHGAYANGDRCVRAAVDTYLLDGQLPAAGKTCPESYQQVYEMPALPPGAKPMEPLPKPLA